MKIYPVYIGQDLTRYASIEGIKQVLKHYETDLKQGFNQAMERILQGERVSIDGILSIN